MHAAIKALVNAQIKHQNGLKCLIMVSDACQVYTEHAVLDEDRLGQVNMRAMVT